MRLGKIRTGISALIALAAAQICLPAQTQEAAPASPAPTLMAAPGAENRYDTLLKMIQQPSILAAQTASGFLPQFAFNADMQAQLQKTGATFSQDMRDALTACADTALNSRIYSATVSQHPYAAGGALAVLMGACISTDTDAAIAQKSAALAKAQAEYKNAASHRRHFGADAIKQLNNAVQTAQADLAGAQKIKNANLDAVEAVTTTVAQHGQEPAKAQQVVRNAILQFRNGGVKTAAEKAVKFFHERKIDIAPNDPRLGLLTQLNILNTALDRLNGVAADGSQTGERATPVKLFGVNMTQWDKPLNPAHVITIVPDKSEQNQVLKVTPYERYIMGSAAEAESAILGESAKAHTVRVILNRDAKKKYFGSSILEILTSPGQFEPITTYGFDGMLKRFPPSAETLKIVDMVIQGRLLASDQSTFFENPCVVTERRKEMHKKILTNGSAQLATGFSGDASSSCTYHVWAKGIRTGLDGAIIYEVPQYSAELMQPPPPKPKVAVKRSPKKPGRRRNAAELDVHRPYNVAVNVAFGKLTLG